jgi:hypothetical protein
MGYTFVKGRVKRLDRPVAQRVVSTWVSLICAGWLP